MLHLEIVQERLEREFSLDLITTAPSVVYIIHLYSGKKMNLHNPSDMPKKTQIDHIEEPWVQATIMLPDQYLGVVLALCIDKRGVQQQLNYTGSRVMVIFKLPLNEIVFDFYEILKSCSQGYASCDWEICGYTKADLEHLTIIVNGTIVDALSLLIHSSKAEKKGRQICTHLKKLIPKHLFIIVIQAVINGRIIARETISALRKNVTAKCYGGDVTRKRKLLEKQRKGKKKLRSIGNVNVPQSAFISVLKIGK
jgi:GTP-binding protein LepA